jgi:parvulin-like peptidyl-prolyl isomerase
MIRKITSLLLLFTTCVAAPGWAAAAEPAQTNPPPSAPSATSTDYLLARGKGFEIRRSQLDREAAAALAQAGANGRTVNAEQRTELDRQVLEQIINVRLVLAKATDADKAAGKAAAERRYAAAKAKVDSEDTFKRQLKLMGTTPENLLAKWTEALTGQEVLKRELKIVITDQEAKAFYDENAKDFDLPETVRIRHILIATLDLRTGAELSADQKAGKHKEAEAVLKRARAGEDFAELAIAFSNDARSRAWGGSYTFSRGQMLAEIETAAFSMKTNQVSDIITTTNGYHVIKLLEKIPAHKIDYPAVAADIKSTLAQRAIQQQFPDYIDQLRKEAGVEVLNDDLKPKGSKVEPIPEPRLRPPTESKKPTQAK